jgi:predicted nucleic acid-binding Zn ribbon protein
MTRVCLVCGVPLEQPELGRPPTYCSPACKNAARHERRRLDRRLANLETYSSNLRMMGDPDRQLGRVQAEIDRATGRLLALLGG